MALKKIKTAGTKTSSTSGASSKKERAVEKKSKPKTAARNKPRVDTSEESGSKVTKSVEHRSSSSRVQSSAFDVGGDEVLIVSQLSELVPVAQYASVTLGPIQIAWKLGNVNMGVLADIDWDSDDVMTEEQEQVWKLVSNALKSSSMLVEERIAEDRETVDRSVRAHNERESK